MLSIRFRRQTQRIPRTGGVFAEEFGAIHQQASLKSTVMRRKLEGQLFRKSRTSDYGKYSQLNRKSQVAKKKKSCAFTASPTARQPRGTQNSPLTAAAFRP
jgi:hypothetical protein